MVDNGKDKREPAEGTFKEHLESKIEETATDVYSKTESVDPDTGVAYPTETSVEEAMDWVDNENPK